MPAEDRDRLFKKALAQHLRSDAAVAGDSACLGAETLAAYHEQLLSPEEMDSAKNHLVACARCQEILAQLEATQDIHQLQTREDARITAGAASRASRITQFPAAKNSLLRWAAPAGAIAAGLLLFIGIRDYRSQPKKSAEQTTQIAENRSNAPGDPQFAPAAPPPIEKEKNETFARQELKEQSAAPPPSTLRDETPTSRPLERSRAGSNADKKFSANAPKTPPKSASGSAESGYGNYAADASKISAKNEPPDRVSQSAALDTAQTSANVLTSESKPTITGGAAAPPPPAPSSAKLAASAQTVTVESSAATPLGKDADQPAIYGKAISEFAALPAIAAAPDGKSVWRFGEHGGIAHSRDSGRTWQSQFAPLTATLNSGSAPSEKICWIAGTAGTLLRTTDSGKHWQLVATPISADLGGVRATDAKHASIWDLSVRLTYETSDGGATWKSIASK